LNTKDAKPSTSGGGLTLSFEVARLDTSWGDETDIILLALVDVPLFKVQETNLAAMKVDPRTHFLASRIFLD
jgi:hypothetical protein